MNWSCTTKAKSDQINADDLLSNGITIKITKVDINTNDAQSGVIHYEGENGKPYKPCKSMRRVIEYKWGSDEAAFAGRSMTLVRDPSVKWAGEEVGGIRISHMSHMSNDDRFMLTYSKNVKRPYKVEHLKTPQAQMKTEKTQPEIAISEADWLAWTEKMDAAQTKEELAAIGKEIKLVSDNYDQESRDKLKAYYSDILAKINKQQEQDEGLPL